jgi:DNA-binding winged helix-turn-helix (wHTH) protein
MQLTRGTVVYRFGPFELDPANRLVLRNGTPVRLSAPQFAILAHFVANPGLLLTKDELVAVAWNGQAVSDNSLEQAIHRIRQELGAGYIETHKQHGYQWVAPVDCVDRRVRDDVTRQHELDLTAVQSRLQLDTLDRADIAQARCNLTGLLKQSPDHALAHSLLGMACGLAFEASVMDERADTATLEDGIRHAHQGRQLDPSSAEAWSTLAFVLGLHDEKDLAVAAANRAITIEPDNWRHAVRLARVAWGEERLQAARRVLTVLPQFALAHSLRATVFIARCAFEPAIEELDLGCIAQDAQVTGAPFGAVGLHLLRGLVHAAHNRLDIAVEELMRELPSSDCGQVYARECGANTWYAIGAVRQRQGRRAEARQAFEHALSMAPFHVAAAAAVRGEVRSSAGPMDRALGEAIVLARSNRHQDAARVYREAVAGQPPGAAGWQLPVEPLLNPLGHAEEWADTLALIRVRAT